MTKETSFDALFRQLRRDAVLLHKPYPPHAGPRTNSKFGGLPKLPAQYEWPRTSKGKPLHFFAQIDCADITFKSPLPKRGVLFFFGRDDDEQVWHQEGPTADNCAVIYALDAFAATPAREVPADLPPIGGYWSFGRAWREVMRESDAGPNVHIEWPIQPLPLDTWPDTLFEDEDQPQSFVERLHRWRTDTKFRQAKHEFGEQQKQYEHLLKQVRADAFTKATGETAIVDPYPPAQDTNAAREIFFHVKEGPEAYPQYWISIHYATRALLHRPRSLMSPSVELTEEGVVAIAEDWLRRSNEIGLDEPVSEEDRSAFRAWLLSMDSPRIPAPLNNATTMVFESLVATIRSWAGDPDRAARLTPHVYEAMRFRFSSFVYERLHFSQMFGNAPSAQNPQPPDSPEIVLLNLSTDYGLGWSFGDAGFCTYWIMEGDLAKRDFSKTWGSIKGH